MTQKDIRALFTPGKTVSVTNHYINRPDHPCFGTTQRTIAKVTASHLWFTTSGNVPWPKASQLLSDGHTVVFMGGGAGQKPEDVFLTIDVREVLDNAAVENHA